MSFNGGFQPVRDVLALISIIFLVLGFILATSPEQRIMFIAESALVFSILSETFARDYPIKEDKSHVPKEKKK